MVISSAQELKEIEERKRKNRLREKVIIFGTSSKCHKLTEYGCKQYEDKKRTRRKKKDAT